MAIIIFSRIAHFLIALATIKVATSLLSPSEFGKTVLIAATTAFFALFLISPVGMLINRRLHSWREHGVATSYLLKYGIYILMVSLTAGAILSFIYEFNWIDFELPKYFVILLVSGTIILNTVNQTVVPSFNILGDRKKFAILSIATTLSSLVFAFLYVKFSEPSAIYWLIGILTGQGIIGIIGVFLFFSYLENYRQSNAPIAKRISIKKAKFLLSFSWPIFIASGLFWIQNYGYRYIMHKEMGLEAVGLFVMGYSVSAGVIASFESVLTAYLQPDLYKYSSNNNAVNRTKAWKDYASIIIPSIIIHSAAMIIMTPEIAKIFIGEKFNFIENFIIWGILAETARVLFGVYSMIAHVHMQTKWLIIPSMAIGFLPLLLCFLLIPHYGANGVGLSLTLAGCTALICMHIIIIKNLNERISVLPILNICLFWGGLWLISVMIRHHGNLPAIATSIIVVSLTGSAYIFFQYKNFKIYLRNK